MENTSSLICTKVTPFSLTLANKKFISSLRPSNKHIDCKLALKNSGAQKSFKTQWNIPLNTSSSGSTVFNLSPNGVTSRFVIQCSSYSDVKTSPGSPNPVIIALKNVSFESLKSTLLNLTPFEVCKWSLAFSIAVAASRWTINVLFSPFFWMYFSWTWLFWPWMVAISLAIYGLYCFNRHLHGNANAFQQLSIVTAAFTWLTLVPPAHFNGFLEGWPIVFFFVYHYFFFFNVSVRKRLYGDYYPREHDPAWDITLPRWQKLLFCVGVMVGHWFAAFEGPELHLVPGGWSNLGIWILIMLTLFMQYHSTLYLAKYSEKVVVPTSVVLFGPYRFVRHPIYASTMLLFVTYFAAMRAPLSALFIVAVCIFYYGQKAKLEELMMVKTFGQMYTGYTNKVRYKFIPFVY
ncbi:unnamed protein product [Coffea canephora]|uniref:Steroid 5-alpha reductase C-terminal domain-containing protein n=1 Tax=Coffea canephora TaxID=49390 RepID=A0A068UN84_COFCA|nr:unnamed protein product [Coffea canephora]